MPVPDPEGPNAFRSLVHNLMLAVHGSAYHVLDDPSGECRLAFLETSRELHAIYCPAKPNGAGYARQFRADLERAKNLRDEGSYPVRSFVFVTPVPLRQPLQRQLSEAARDAGFDDGLNVSADDLDVLLGRSAEPSGDPVAPSAPSSTTQTVSAGGIGNVTIVVGRDLRLDGAGSAEALQQGERLRDQMQLLLAANPPERRKSRVSGTDAELLRHYVEWVVETYDDLELPGLPRRERRGNVPLENVFVALRGGLGGTYEARQSQALLEEQAAWVADATGGDGLTAAERYRRRCRVAAALARHPHPEAIRERDRAHLYQVGVERTLPLSAAFRRERRLVILGDPGSGKSTLLKWLAVQFARAYLAGKPEVDVLIHHADPEAAAGSARVSLGPTRVPVLLRIAQFAHDRQAVPGRRFGSFLGHHLGQGYGDAVVDSRGRTLDAHRLNRVLRQLVDEGRTVLLLDGLDEITDPDARYAITAELDEFLNGALVPTGTAADGEDGARPPWRAGGNQAVVTSRIVGYSVAPLRGEAAQLTIEPMGERAIDRFCELWVRAVHQASVPRNRWDDAEGLVRSEADALKAAIRELRERGSGDLATNPLLLTILALVFRDGRSGTGSPSFPRERVRLYDTAIRILIRTWQERARLKGDRVFTDTEVLAALTPVAEHIHRTSGIGVIDEETLHGLLRSELPPGDADAFAAVVRTEVGLLAARGEGVYGFLHLTFQEFLAARAVLERPGDLGARLTAYLGEPRWREPSLMALGLARQRMPDADFQRLLEGLLGDADPLSRALPLVESLLAASLNDVADFPEAVLETMVGRLLDRYGAGAAQGRLSGLRGEIERITRRCVAGAHARVAERAFLAALRSGEAGRVCTAASLLRAVGFHSPALASALTDALELDDEARGWPVDRALRSLVARHPALLPGPVDGLKAQLTRNPALAGRFTQHPGWARIGITLYGGLDSALDETVSTLQAGIARTQTRIEELTAATAPGGARHPDVERLEAEAAELRERIKRVRAQAFELHPARMHRESTLTPHVVSALRAGRSAPEFAATLRDLAVANESPAVTRDALLAMTVLAESAEALASLPAPLLTDLCADARRVSGYVSPVVEASAQAVVDSVGETGFLQWDAEYLRYTFRALSRLVRGPLLQPPDLGTLSERVPEQMADELLAESLVKHVVTPTDDPVYSWAVTLDTQGHQLGSDPARLARALALVPRCAAARWRGARRWVRHDPLVPVPEDPVDAAAAALDTLAAMPDVLDFVRGWMLARLAPVLAEADLVAEAVLLCLFSVSDRFGCRREALDALLGSQAATPAAEQKDGVLRAHRRQVETVSDPYRRVRAELRLVTQVPRLLDAGGAVDEDGLAGWIERIDRPERRARAWIRLRGLGRSGRNGQYLDAAVHAARQVAEPDLRARLLARLAFDSAVLGADGLVHGVFTALSETRDLPKRAKLLADLREAVDGADVAPDLRTAFRQGCDEHLARIDEPFWRAAASGRVAPPLAVLAGEFGGRLRGIGTLLLSALLTDAQSVLGPRGAAAPLSSAPAHNLDPFSELESRLRDEARSGAVPLDAGAARLVDRLVSAGRVDEATPVLSLVSGAGPSALPHVRDWLGHGDAALRRHAALILAEAGNLNLETVPAVCDWLGSDDDLPRLRALRVLNFDTTRERRLRASGVGDDVLRYLMARRIDMGDRDVQQANILGWFFERVLLDEPMLLEGWVETLDRGGALADEAHDPTYRLLSAFMRTDGPVLDAVMAKLPTVAAPGQRALFDLVCLVAGHGGIPDAQLAALLPVLRDAADALRAITYLPDPFRSVVDVLESLAPSPDLSSAEIALHAEEEASRRIRFVECAWETPAQLHRQLVDLGSQHLVGRRWTEEVRTEVRRLIQRPELFELLLRWIDGLEELRRPVTVEEPYVYVGNALLELAAAASEQLPDALFRIAGSLPFFGRRLRRSARGADSFPARQAAFVLLSFAGTIDAGVVEAIHGGLRDNVEVQRTLLQTLDRYRAIEQGAVESLLQGIDDASASFAFASLRLLRAVARNPRFEEASRRMITEAVAQALERPLATRDVYLCDVRSSEAWTIRYAGQLGDACYELLSELSGFSTEPANQGW